MTPRTYKILWTAFIFLLLVLLPHTAWYFGHAEDQTAVMIPFLNLSIVPGLITAWGAALAFESAIAIFTHLLAKHIEKTPNYTEWQKRAWRRYGNVYTVALFVSLLVSISANYRHALTFSQDVYIAITTGAILPICSFLFARALANKTDSEPEPNEAEREVNGKIREQNKTIREQNTEIERLNTQLTAANAYRTLFDETLDAAERIRSAAQLFPNVSQNTIAQILNLSKSYVSTVFSENGFHRTPAEQE